MNKENIESGRGSRARDEPSFHSRSAALARGKPHKHLRDRSGISRVGLETAGDRKEHRSNASRGSMSARHDACRVTGVRDDRDSLVAQRERSGKSPRAGPGTRCNAEIEIAASDSDRPNNGIGISGKARPWHIMPLQHSWFDKTELTHDGTFS